MISAPQIRAEHVFDLDARIKCPAIGCGRTILREELSIVNGWRRIRAHCAYCDYQQIAGCGPRGEMCFFDDGETPPSLMRSKAEIEAEQRRKENAELRTPPPTPPTPPASPAPAAAPASSPHTSCAAPGCELDVKTQGLCNMHQARWYGANKPKMEDWLAAGAPTPGEWAKRLAALPKARPKPVAAEAAHEPAAKPEPPMKIEWPKPAPHETPQERARPAAPLQAETQKPLAFCAADWSAHQVLRFEWPVEEVRVMRLGEYITLTDETGRVLGQIHIGEDAEAER